MRSVILPDKVVLQGTVIRSCIAVDLSLNSTGVIFLNQGRMEDYKLITFRKGLGKIVKDDFLMSHVMVLDEDKDDIYRNLQISNYLLDCLKLWMPDIVVIENYSFGARGRAMFSIGELNGLVKANIYSCGYKLCLISPTVVKKAITGKGNATKTMVALSVFKKFKVDFSQYLKHGEDLCDAFALGVTFFMGKELKWMKDFMIY